MAEKGYRSREGEERFLREDRAGEPEREAVGQETREGQEGPRQDGRRLGAGMGMVVVYEYSYF